MFQKRIIELFTFLSFWVVITPAVYKYCEKQEWLKWDFNAFITSMTNHATFLLILILAYIVFYRIILFTYSRLKVCDVKMWHNLKKTQADPEAMLPKKTHYKAVSLEDLDTVDGKTKSLPPKRAMIHTISNPLLVEKDLAAIHIKHETLPLHLATLPRTHGVKQSPTPSVRSLRCAPPVPCSPQRTPGRAHKVRKNEVIMSPNVLLHTK